LYYRVICIIIYYTVKSMLIKKFLFANGIVF
jgi:hypothetical protein